MRSTIGIFKSPTIISILLLAGSSAFAQSSSDLQARYGAPYEAYEVRPHILMTVLFGAVGQACEMDIEARHRYDGLNGTDLIPLPVIEEILEEVAPTEERGKVERLITFSGGCSSLRSGEYENVSIYRTELCLRSSGKAVEEVRIKWKHRQCESRE
jgi:hypothetical protein